MSVGGLLRRIREAGIGARAVIESGNNGADLDYGPRGPQHRDKMLIRPAS
jgi:hypothetical protein